MNSFPVTRTTHPKTRPADDALRFGEAAPPRIALARFFAENCAVQAGALERTVIEGGPGLIAADTALAS